VDDETMDDRTMGLGSAMVSSSYGPIVPFMGVSGRSPVKPATYKPKIFGSDRAFGELSAATVI